MTVSNQSARDRRMWFVYSIWILDRDDQLARKKHETRDITTIHPGIGLGNLKFGTTREQVRDYLGKPEKIDDSEKPSGWLRWEYPRIGVDAHFDFEFGLRLISLTIENRKATLNGKEFVGLDSKTALKLASSHGLGEYKRDEEDAALGWEAEFDDLSLEFRFCEDRLLFISWRVFITDDDVVHWPS